MIFANIRLLFVALIERIDSIDCEIASKPDLGFKIGWAGIMN